MLKTLWNNRWLIVQMTMREVASRYRGSLLGVSWLIINPLLMLATYTFVFSFVFKARWGVEQSHTNSEFALVLFVGLIIHALLTEVLVRAPTHILSNPNYVKKVVFPLETLTVVSLCTSLFHAMISFAVLLIALITFTDSDLVWTILLLPITLAPILPLTLGLGWFLTSLGVYIRDLGQFIGIFCTAMMFLSPVFYPITVLPEAYQYLLYLNPLTVPIQETREVIIFGGAPNWKNLFIYSGISIPVCLIGFLWFQKTRKGFADVL